MAPEGAVRLGMIVPSSNTCLEPTTYRIIGDRRDVSVHFARIGVTRIALDRQSDNQFSAGAMTAAAALLADAKVDVIAWNGTSGSWLGLEHDRRIVDVLAATAGVPATTSTVALLAALREVGTAELGLATPYTPDVNEAIVRVYANEGVRVRGASALGISVNEEFANVAPATVARQVREVANGVGAVAVLCTNLHGAELAEPFEAEHGVPLIDSVAVTLWHALRLTGRQPRLSGYGRLLAGSHAREPATARSIRPDDQDVATIEKGGVTA
jgi:maleate isomerase